MRSKERGGEEATGRLGENPPSPPNGGFGGHSEKWRKRGKR